MGALEARGWELAAYLLLDLMRYLTWALMGALIAMGACWTCWYGGCAAYTAWRDKGPPTPRRHQRAQERREAARGIAAIEAFLAAQATAPGRPRGEDPAPDARPETGPGEGDPRA